MYTPITLDKNRNLRLGMKAISLIEKKLKKPIGKVDMENLTMEDIATILWAGLVHEDRALTVEKTIDLIDEYSNINTAIRTMTQAMKDSFGNEGVEPSTEISTEKN